MIAPVAVVGVLLAIGVNNQMDKAQDADRTAELVRDSEQVTRLINDVQAEHRQALLLSVEQESVRPGDALPSTADYRRTQQTTDEQVTAVRSAFGPGLPKDEARALDYIRSLAVLRDKVERGSVPAAGIDPAYAAAVGYLIDGIGLDRFIGTSSSSVTNLLDAVLRADAAHAAFESGVFSAQTRDANALTEYTRAAGAHHLYDEQAERFARIADPDQVLRLGGIERDAEENGIEARFAELQIDPGSLQGQTPQQLRKAIAAGTRQAETRLDITRSLIDQIAVRADSLSTDALRTALAMLGLALLGFASWLTFSVLVRRSVVRPLTALTGAAQQVVDVAGGELAKVEDDESPERTPLQPRPIPVPVQDEIGHLAEAFNQVQVTAAALLERQVLSRRNVAEMFGNVGRRVSNLTSRQLMLIDAVEREETDPDVLERMYRIDHIAVRLQRNADSLMLLAGIRDPEMEARPTTLVNVIRAGLGQIEGYQRVSLRSETEVTVGPDIVDDLTLMLAELLENAVSFSPSDTPVEVVVRPGTDITSDGGALIEIIDHGLGMSAERLDEENSRLVRRERLDLVPTKVLGLFVVGNLARRSGIRVTLSRTPGGGVTGTVWLPSALLLAVHPAATPSPAADAAGPEPVSEHPATPEQAPTAPAPETASATPLPVRTPATTPERRPAAPSRPGELPRRLPHRTDAERTASASASEPKPGDAARPLRRRVRGATLNMTTPTADREAQAVRRPVDADAVRSELDEFEAAVRRAEQESAPAPRDAVPSSHQQPRKESGSDDADR
ncbi:HAMP domain-containing protein [Streptomyces sp. Je 1-4]|uniref:ATP-binding protein n=1 Tax=Streptomyces TaxID=1883 RepID=UPI00140EE74E|nr:MULTISPECIES: ATP-binding protein [unclassified Streptomyces]QIK11059.1 HAMP domain-containing protein [Streptomyces sp. ID38640]UYB44654.1 HAMP domain-containing protein [Streptomyces sp. Je 1-4]UZQ34544.1 HAMP domain-containing protein [Streptomyces sp. Je 1-4] [Streptomyces sp. Je 1-4 4N24]UZQ41962.1 HAMP domain-containing protein [Streptomyces sp. Je 1-4] [Streptomyces sp. Je 1-4 4N24_ara]